MIFDTSDKCPPVLLLKSIINESILSFSNFSSSLLNCSELLAANMDIEMYPIFLFSLSKLILLLV